METKHLLALLFFVVAGCGSILAAAFSQRLRDVAFFAMVCCSISAEWLDVNFGGEYWYRGTSRGFGVAITDILAIAILLATWAAPRHPPRRGFVPASLGVIGLYFGYCAYMSINALQPSFAWWELANIPRGVLVLLAGAAYLRSRRELAVLVLALALTAAIEAVFAVWQRYGAGVLRAHGTLGHPNSLSMYVCMIGPVLLAAALARWSVWLRVAAGAGATAASVCVLLAISRAGLPIYVAVMSGTAIACLPWQITRQRVLGAAAVVAACALAVVATWDEFRSRYSQATLAQEYLDEQKDGRGVYLRWALAIAKDHPLGVGLNNWSYAVSKHYGAVQGFEYFDYDQIKQNFELADVPSTHYAAPAHSLAALTIGELGVPGFVLFTLVWFRWFKAGADFLVQRLQDDPTHRLGIGILFATAGVFLQSLTEWTFRQATIFLLFHILVGGLMSLHWMRCRVVALARSDDCTANPRELSTAAPAVSVVGNQG